MSLISFISGLSWISPSCSRRNLANTNPFRIGLVSRVSLSERGYLSSTPIMSFSPCFKKRKDSCSFCHPTSPFPTERRRSKFGTELIWPKLWEKQPRCIRVGGTEGGPSGKSGRMAITSKNTHKIKHQRERERFRSQLKCTDVSLRPSKQQNLLPETSRAEGGGRPSEFSHLLLELLPVARSESSPGSLLLELLERGRREKREGGDGEEGERGWRDRCGIYTPRWLCTLLVWWVTRIVVEEWGECWWYMIRMKANGPIEKKKQPSSDFKLFIVPFGMLHKDKTWCLML